ncbi:MAG: hypothetical protein MUF01_17100 [Bryobacterales bacterium]|nr:hypothetical protein [Bryobacterales bacterium]
MATAANWQQDEIGYQDTGRTGWRESTDKYRLRSIPNEDVYFYSKRVDNSRLVRPVDHATRRQEIRVMVGGFGLLLLVVVLTLPDLLNVMAGAQLQKLRAENDRLLAAHAALTVEEERLMSPERMKAIAQRTGLVEAPPQQFLHVPPPRKPETEEAKLKP